MPPRGGNAGAPRTPPAGDVEAPAVASPASTSAAAPAGDGERGGGAAEAAPIPSTAECRICLEPGDGDLASPCACTGTVAYAHIKCLQTWVEERRGLMVCEICGAPYSEAVAPSLAEAAARGEARARAAAAAAVAAAPPPAAPGCLSPRARAWAAAALVFVVALALLYVVLFVGGDHQPSYWAVLLLRVLAFVLPVYLILQACLALARYRRARQAAGDDARWRDAVAARRWGGPARPRPPPPPVAPPRLPPPV